MSIVEVASVQASFHNLRLEYAKLLQLMYDIKKGKTNVDDVAIDLDELKWAIMPPLTVRPRSTIDDLLPKENGTPASEPVEN